MNNKLFKVISIILVVTIFVTGMPALSFADNGEDKSTAPILLPHTEKQSEIIGEVVEERDINSKVFKKNDGTYELAVYPVAIHYEKDGKYEDIDNSLKKKRGKEEVYQNQENDYTIELAEENNSNELVKISKDDYSISWSYINMDKPKKLEKNKEPITKYKNNKNIDDSLKGDDKVKFLENLSTEIVYENIEPNIDLSYDIEPDKVKESIILNEVPESNEYKFRLNTNGLKPVLNKDKTISFFDEKDIKNEVMSIDSPYMVDSAEETAYSMDIDVKLDKKEDNYVLTISPNMEWLKDKSREYPIIIDPTINTTTNATQISDSTVRSAFPTSNEYLSSFTRVGRGATNGICRTYTKYTIPNLTAADMVIDAKMNLYLNSDDVTTGRDIDLHKVTKDWESETITWNNKPSYESKVCDFLNVSGNENKKLTWDITSIVKDWYTTGNNYGIMIKNNNETPNHYIELYSSDTTSTAYRPQVSINYVNYTGIEDYWTYHSKDVGRAGTGYVNDYNGNVVFTHDDISMTGNRMPINIYHVYNSNEKGTDIGYGLGWRLNLSQTIKAQKVGGVQYHVYTDEDGTKHYFKGTSGTLDESGLGIKLTKNSDNTFKIIDKESNIINFNTSGVISTIVDSNRNKITYTYGANGTKPESVTDPSGRKVMLSYSGGKLSSITDPDGRKVEEYTYSSNKLSGIKYLDGNSSTYAYLSNNNLDTATNYDGYRLKFTYYSGISTRVKKTQETHTNGTAGNELTFRYGFNTTTFVDVKGRKNVYQFNNEGNTVSMRDDDGNGQYFEYGSSEGSNNKLTLESNVQKAVINLIKNHNMELDLDDWKSNSSDGSVGKTSNSTEAKYTGEKSLKISKTNADGTQYCYQRISSLKSNTEYTLSAYIKTSNIDSNGSKIWMTYTDSEGIKKRFYSRKITGTNDWKRVEVTFKLPDGITTADVVFGNRGIGTTYFDSFQLEEGLVANKYNLIENPDFIHDGEYKWYAENTSSNDKVIQSTESEYPSSLDKNCYKLTGERDKKKYVYNVVKTSGKAGDTYTFGGWAKGSSVAIRGERYFAMYAQFNNSDGSK